MILRPSSLMQLDDRAVFYRHGNVSTAGSISEHGIILSMKMLVDWYNIQTFKVADGQLQSNPPIGVSIVQDADRGSLLTRFLDVAEFLNRQFYAGLLETLGGVDLTIQQVKILALLQARGSLCMSEIADLMGRTLSPTTSIVERLVEKGLTVRESDPTDRRLVICVLTDEGRSELTRFFHISVERLEAVAGMMDNDQLAAATNGLEAIRNAEIAIEQAMGVQTPDGTT